MNAMAAKPAARLARNPNDGRGWALLARAYAWLGRYAEADAAFAQAARLKIDGYRSPSPPPARRSRRRGAGGGAAPPRCANRSSTRNTG